jgi:hypothetical protein
VSGAEGAESHWAETVGLRRPALLDGERIDVRGFSEPVLDTSSLACGTPERAHGQMAGVARRPLTLAYQGSGRPHGYWAGAATSRCRSRRRAPPSLASRLAHVVPPKARKGEEHVSRRRRLQAASSSRRTAGSSRDLPTAFSRRPSIRRVAPRARAARPQGWHTQTTAPADARKLRGTPARSRCRSSG